MVLCVPRFVSNGVVFAQEEQLLARLTAERDEELDIVIKRVSEVGIIHVPSPGLNRTPGKDVGGQGIGT